MSTSRYIAFEHLTVWFGPVLIRRCFFCSNIIGCASDTRSIAKAFVESIAHTHYCAVDACGRNRYRLLGAFNVNFNLANAFKSVKPFIGMNPDNFGGWCKKAHLTLSISRTHTFSTMVGHVKVHEKSNKSAGQKTAGSGRGAGQK